MNDLAIAVVVVLFPGVIACVICDRITVHQPKWESFKYSLYSVVLGVLCYVFLQVFASAIWLLTMSFVPPLLRGGIPVLTVWSLISAHHAGAVSLVEVAMATIVAPIVASVAALIVNLKLINKLAQRLRLSDKYGDENLFSFFLNSKEVDWIYIRDIANDLTYQGRVVSFAENDDMQELVLSEVTVFSYKESKEYYSIPHLYLAKPVGTFIIEAVPQDVMEEQ